LQGSVFADQCREGDEVPIPGDEVNAMVLEPRRLYRGQALLPQSIGSSVTEPG
jgi:hypothetical protein